MTDKLRLGVSACLLGESVRYDGQHKRDSFIVDTLGRYVDYVPVCPEVECGLPVPREAMRLVGTPDNPRLMTQRTGRDLTGQMLGWVERRLAELEREPLCGFIFKAKSPSSGMERVKIYNDKGGVAAMGAGLFAAAFMRRFPLLPVEDEGRLHDPALRENFIERIFTLKRYRDETAASPTLAALMRFHEQHKFLIQSHSVEHAREMGKMLGSARRGDAARLRSRYEERLLEALRMAATPCKHANMLQHMLGFLKQHLSGEEKQEMLGLIAEMKGGVLPLMVPLTLLQHYARKYRADYLLTQAYLFPHPLEVALRNHA